MDSLVFNISTYVDLHPYQTLLLSIFLLGAIWNQIENVLILREEGIRRNGARKPTGITKFIT